jgi:hypothetical protein
MPNWCPRFPDEELAKEHLVIRRSAFTFLFKWNGAFINAAKSGAKGQV